MWADIWHWIIAGFGVGIGLSLWNFIIGLIAGGVRKAELPK